MMTDDLPSLDDLRRKYLGDPEVTPQDKVPLTADAVIALMEEDRANYALQDNIMAAEIAKALGRLIARAKALR